MHRILRRIPVDRDLIDVVKLKPGDAQALLDGERRKHAASFDSIQTLLRHGSDDLTMPSTSTQAEQIGTS